MPDLDEVFTDAPENVEAEPVEKTEPVETLPETTSKAEEATPPKEDAEPAAAEDKQVAAFKTAAIDERRKRQAAQAETQALQTQLNNLQPPPDALEQPQEAMNHMANEFQTKLNTMGSDMSRQVMLAVKDDYLEMEVKFLDLAEENPALVSQMVASQNPAKFAYDTAKKHGEWEKIQDIDTYKATIRAEVIADIKSGMTDEQLVKKEKEAKQSNVDLPSLANVGTSGNETVTDESLENLFDR